LPYPSKASLPDAVKKLPDHAQEIWRKAWNNAYKTYGNETQAFKVAWAAVAKYKREDLHSDFQRIYQLFLKQFGEDEGPARFSVFIDSNELDPEKPYNPLLQFTESFQWVQPLIRYYKTDHEAKYYLVRALTANISMNHNDYSDYTKLKQAALSLSHRPVNINHNHSRWLPFPRTRVDFTRFDDMSVEATLRVDNEDAWLQQKLDAGDILHPSIEGRPEPEGMGEGWHFTGMALLEKGAHLPGDPLTEIKPIFFESVGNQVCKLVDGNVVCDDSCLTETQEVGERENKVKEDNKEVSEIAKALPLPNSCTCPECGQIDRLTVEVCDRQKCSECGHQMSQTPSVPAHSGRSGESQPPKETEVTAELFRPPFPLTPNKRFATVVGNLKKMSGEPSLPKEAVEWVNGLVEWIRTDAVASEEEKAKLVKTATDLEIETKALREDKVKDSEDLAEKTKKIVALNLEVETIPNLKKRITKETTAKNKLRGKINEQAKTIADQTETINTKDGANEKLTEKLGGYEAKIEKLEANVDKLEVTVAAEKTKAVNASKNESKAKLETADAKREVAKATRKISDLTTKVSELTTEIYDKEQELADKNQDIVELKNDHAKELRATKKTFEKQLGDKDEVITGKNNEITGLQEIVGKAKKFQKWAWKELGKVGVIPAKK